MTSPSSSTANRQRLGPILAVVLVLLCAGCEVDDSIVTDIGTALLFVQDSDIAGQVVALDSAGEYTIQVAAFDIKKADLTVGDTTVDLLFGETCQFLDTSAVLAFGKGNCAGGVVLDADGMERPATLELEFTLEVRRAKPVDLSPGGDYDFDTIPDEVDNCPLVENRDQFDTGSKGFGDACAGFDPIFGLSELDSDRDTVIDGSDNCVQFQNRDQADDGIELDGTTVPDGIGTACTQQVAEVRSATTKATDIQLSLGPIPLLQPYRRAALLSVDLKSSESLTCDWVAGTCDLDGGKVRFCLLTTFGTCP